MIYSLYPLLKVVSGISLHPFAVGYYLRYNISYRDLVEMMRDRGIFVHHTTL
ncbi:IS6 family transposase, partial [Lacticaseibacillus paracasei]|nr:IS6 family transposase [Lacticaseibacillus paracasei]